MRKILSLLLCVAMLCSLVVITAQADGEPYVEFEDQIVAAGGSAIMEINLLDNPGIATVAITFVCAELEGVTYNFENATSASLSANENMAFWLNATDFDDETLGTVTINIPADAPAGEYTFTAQLSEGYYQSHEAVEFGDDAEFTITVINPTITGVNVSISTDLSIGIHTNTTSSITAVNVAAKEFTTISSPVSDGKGGYIFYLNVNPWAMDAEFVVDFTSRFSIEDDKLDLDAIPESARTISILSYCEALLDGAPSDELTQLIADLLAYGQAAQIYNGAENASFDLPADLEPTVGDWVADEMTFGEYCLDNYENVQEEKATSTVFKFDYVTVELGAKFVATFTVAKTGSKGISNARVAVDDGDATKVTYGKSSDTSGTFKYIFSPADFAGHTFDLYSGTKGASNYAWSMIYGPTYYASYLCDTHGADADDLLALLEAFYNYGVSADAYAKSLS